MKRDAQAVILDALVFLMVVTIVSSSLLLVDASDEPSDFQEYVERAHHALLRSTMEMGNRNMTLFEVTLLVMISSTESGWGNLIEWINNTLDSLMVPRFNYEWSASSSRCNISIGMSQIPQYEDIYASVFQVDYLGEDISIGLRAWARL